MLAVLRVCLAVLKRAESGLPSLGRKASPTPEDGGMLERVVDGRGLKLEGAASWSSTRSACVCSRSQRERESVCVCVCVCAARTLNSSSSNTQDPSVQDGHGV